MRLHLRLFLLLSGLLLLLVAGAVWGVRVLTTDLGRALDDAGLSVGRAVVAVLQRDRGAPENTGRSSDAAAEGVESIQRYERTLILRRKTLMEPGSEGAPDRSAPEDLTEGITATDPVSLQRSELHLQLEQISGAAGELKLLSDGVQHVIRVPRSGTEQALERFSRHVLLGAAAALLIGLLLSYGLARRLARPLADLAQTAVLVGGGQLGKTVPVRGGPELRATLQTFNHMSSQLKLLDEERTRLLELKGLGELGEVARGMAHSLRNPLNTLTLALDALAQDANTESTRVELRGRARDQIRRIDDALKSLLVLGTAGASGSREIDLRDLLDDVLLEAAQRSAGRVQMSLDVPPEHDPTLRLRVQPHELRAALQALLVNALEASPDGAQVQLSLRALPGGRVGIRIADRGAGIPPQIRERLYTPHATSKPDGAGMGLFLAQRIIRDRYGGTLELRDREGGGTLAEVEIGARKDD